MAAVSARLASVMAAAAIAASVSLGAQDARVAKVLERARLALAGGTERALPNTFSIVGQRLVVGDEGKPYSFETPAELPDKFVWKQVTRTSATRRGFDGNRLITDVPQEFAANSSRAHGRADVVRDGDQLQVIRAQFAALTLGLFATSLRSVPLMFSDVQGGEAANAIGVAGRDVAVSIQ